MRRPLVILLGTLLFIAAFGATLWFFMPWREVGTAALSLGAPALEKQGLRLGFSGVSAVDGGFMVSDLSLGGMVSLSFQSVTIRPQLLMSVMNLSLVCDVEFRGWTATMGLPMSFGDGGFLLTASSREVMLERLNTDGDFSVSGFLSFDLGKMKIGRADAALKVPESFEENMGTLQNFLPLVREGNGNWFLRRAGTEGGK
jgi:hypothetical protein